MYAYCKFKNEYNQFEENHVSVNQWLKIEIGTYEREEHRLKTDLGPFKHVDYQVLFVLQDLTVFNRYHRIFEFINFRSPPPAGCCQKHRYNASQSMDLSLPDIHTTDYR